MVGPLFKWQYWPKAAIIRSHPGVGQHRDARAPVEQGREKGTPGQGVSCLLDDAGGAQSMSCTKQQLTQHLCHSSKPDMRASSRHCMWRQSQMQAQQPPWPVAATA
jgi:hypothetical protein